MPYFDQSADKLERIGKIIADIFMALLAVGFVAIFTYSAMIR